MRQSQELAFQQMKVAADRARVAESATLRSALAEVRAEAARGAKEFYRAEDAEQELRRLRQEKERRLGPPTPRKPLETDGKLKDNGLKTWGEPLKRGAQRRWARRSRRELDLTKQLCDAERRAALVPPEPPPLPAPPPVPRPAPGPGQGPIDPQMRGFRAGPLPLGDKANELRLRAEDLNREVQQWRQRRE